MGSKYDSYWQARLGDLSRLVADAAAGKVASLVFDDIVNHGDRRSWHGNARIRGRIVLTSQMAHLDSLARITTGAGIFDQWPHAEFSLSMNDARTVTIRAGTDRQRPEGAATHARARPMHTALAVVADVSPATEPAIACTQLHTLLGSLSPYDRPEDIPFNNGLYFFYEAGENSAHAPDGRIVRIGNHPRAQDRLIGRLKDHYRTRPNAKNGSVFRRYIGGALLRRDNPRSSCLMPASGKGHWEQQHADECPTCALYEERVTEHMKQAMRFRCLRIDDLKERNAFEALLIATVAACPTCTPSPQWLGQHCYSRAVRATGLWNSEFVYGTAVTEGELDRLHTLARARTVDATDDLADTLLIIPCSASKRGTVLSRPLTPRTVADDLDNEARQMLEEGRQLAFTKRGTSLNETSPRRPALEWYTGQPYETAGFRSLLLGALERGLHCLIISGGYGLLCPEEPIHSYEAHMPTQTRSVWERRLRVLLPNYIKRYAIGRVFVSVSNAYAQCLPDSLGTLEEWRCVPAFDRDHDTGSAMRVVPERVGAAVTSLLASDFSPGPTWRKFTPTE
ncbi:MAG: DUF7664 domain-containing protein [Acidimicrobiia bacterium]